MAQILDRLPSEYLDRILCYYINATSKVKIVRITNIQNWYFEHVVFPQERLLFEALPDALLEIHETTPTGTTLLDIFSCAYLRVNQGKSSSIDTPLKVACVILNIE